eukprot:TRINITY_DN10327_c0_g1_i1.p1 TRINITY_DN10327_c0_g1~~TRINITY_DN10327_c0_g1_i1.p1  ORF type:complete len:329 (+),score=-35.03 TRINITY_DN10327_c0_g1_i1:423-1409(+)
MQITIKLIYQKKMQYAPATRACCMQYLVNNSQQVIFQLQYKKNGQLWKTIAQKILYIGIQKQNSIFSKYSKKQYVREFYYNMIKTTVILIVLSQLLIFYFLYQCFTINYLNKSILENIIRTPQKLSEKSICCLRKITKILKSIVFSNLLPTIENSTKRQKTLFFEINQQITRPQCVNIVLKISSSQVIFDSIQININYSILFNLIIMFFAVNIVNFMRFLFAPNSFEVSGYVLIIHTSKFLFLIFYLLRYSKFYMTKKFYIFNIYCSSLLEAQKILVSKFTQNQIFLIIFTIINFSTILFYTQFQIQHQNESKLRAIEQKYKKSDHNI